MYKVFNNLKILTEGWYWVLPSNELKKKQIKAINIVDKELAIFRAESGEVKIFDAYCAHMGAHFAEGKVEGEGLRCFFHHWKYDSNGKCIEIPCQNSLDEGFASVKSWKCSEHYGMIWVWLSENEPPGDFPKVPELEEEETFAVLGNKFFQNCHPNVVMINAIDEQHFH